MPPLSNFILSLLSSKFGLDGSILMVHEWMKTFFISLNFGATPYPTPFGCLSWWVGNHQILLSMKHEAHSFHIFIFLSHVEFLLGVWAVH